MQIVDYTVHILVDDKELEEHHTEFETPTRATCWIASEQGKTFSIKWRSHAETRTKGNAGWVTVDGIFCGGSPMYPGRLGEGDTAEMSNIGTDNKTRDFIFSRIQLSDDDRLLNKEVPPGFGEISLEIEHGRLVKDRRVRHKDMGVSGDDDKFHETSNKAAHHRIGFGPERARNDRPSKCVSRLVVNDEPSLFFIFKYRPIALLQAHGLVPRPNTSDNSPTSSPRPDPTRSQSNGNDSHKAELQERIQNLKNELKRLQDLEARLSEEPKPKKINSEDSGLGKQSRSVSEVSDLTKD